MCLYLPNIQLKFINFKFIVQIPHLLEHLHQWMQTSCLILYEKTCFFYFTHVFLQNTYFNLSILHIYSIKYSLFYNFLLFTSSLPLSLTDPQSITINDQSTPSHHHHHRHHPTSIVKKNQPTQSETHSISNQLITHQTRNPVKSNHHPPNWLQDHQNPPMNQKKQTDQDQNPPIKIFNPPIKIPATINSINTHGSIPIKTHHQPDQYPTNQYPSKPKHLVPKSSATTSFLGLVQVRSYHLSSATTSFACWDCIGDEWDRWEWDRWDQWPEVRLVD